MTERWKFVAVLQDLGEFNGAQSKHQSQRQSQNQNSDPLCKACPHKQHQIRGSQAVKYNPFLLSQWLHAGGRAVAIFTPLCAEQTSQLDVGEMREPGDGVKQKRLRTNTIGTLPLFPQTLHLPVLVPVPGWSEGLSSLKDMSWQRRWLALCRISPFIAKMSLTKTRSSLGCSLYLHCFV